nr:hypothetical protein [Yoonia sp.]
MLRFFISPHPTFGRDAQPHKWKVEASPYFWWWYALTQNADYAQFVQDMVAGAVEVDTLIEQQQKMLRVYEDFGDVGFEGCRYAAFARWWRERLNTNETRGERLFAEPLLQRSVRLLQHVDDAAAVLSSEDVLVLAVPRDMQRQHVDKAIDRILRKHVVTKKGRTLRNPKLSQARYSMSKPVLAQSMKKAFDVYDLRTAAADEGVKLSNEKVAKAAKLAYTQKSVDNEAEFTPAQRKRVVSAIVARHYKDAKTMIANAAIGCFPT